MALIYWDLIRKNLKKIEDVPLRWRAAVEAMLEQES
ncbi:CD1375 family protein [Paenibacillus dendritiformis]|nr:CD1375 family protein [Paenibacillus dendritiformis]